MHLLSPRERENSLPRVGNLIALDPPWLRGSMREYFGGILPLRGKRELDYVAREISNVVNNLTTVLTMQQSRRLCHYCWARNCSSVRVFKKATKACLSCELSGTPPSGCLARLGSSVGLRYYRVE